MHDSRLPRRLRAQDPRPADARRAEDAAGEVASPKIRDRLGDALPHCIDCGCCCFSADPEYIRLFEIDLDRMGPRARSFTSGREGRVVMRMSEGRCSALVVDPSARTFSCAVYEERPDVCRWLARGSGTCIGDRRDKVGATLIALGAARAPRA